MLFHSTIFGPVTSRRLGVSLGVNLLPINGKICSFDCIYCECGYNADYRNDHRLPTTEMVLSQLEKRLQEMKSSASVLDVITFAGNGEPTLHPDFEPIIEGTIALRNRYYPRAMISVLSNATQITSPSVQRALAKIDKNILKLDSAISATIELINAPNNPNFSGEKAINSLTDFDGEVIIQTLFTRGTHQGKVVDNTTEEELSAWLEAIKRIGPQQVMIYTIDRETPEKSLQRIGIEELQAIAARVETLGITTQVAG